MNRTPEFERCLLLCESCFQQASDPKKFQPGEHWRILAEQAWSENLMVQIVAIRLLRRQESSQDWAREALEGLYLDEDTETLVTEAL